MHDDGDTGLVHPGPEGVEDRVGRGEHAVGGVDRGRAHHDGAGVVVERPLELLDRPVDVGEGDVGAGEDAVLVGEAPVLLEPPVERGEHEGDGLGVVLEGLLVDHPEGGEEPHLLEAVLVHRGEAGVAVAVRGVDGLRATEVLERGLARGVAAEVVGHGAGGRHRVEGGVGHRTADLATDHVVLALADLAPLDDARPELRVEVAGERVLGLVVVVVGVERLVAELVRDLFRVVHRVSPRVTESAPIGALVSHVRATNRPTHHRAAGCAGQSPRSGTQTAPLMWLPPSAKRVLPVR